MNKPDNPGYGSVNQNPLLLGKLSKTSQGK